MHTFKYSFTYINTKNTHDYGYQATTKLCTPFVFIAKNVFHNVVEGGKFGVCCK